MRQNEREIKFIRVGDAVSTAGQLTGELTLNRGSQSTFIARVQGVGQGSCRSFADWMRHVYWVGKSRANTFSLQGRRGDRLYCSISSYNMGEGRTIRVWFFHSCIPRPSLVLSALSSLGHHNLFHAFLVFYVFVGSGSW